MADSALSFATLEALFRESELLPQLPEYALRVAHAIDQGETRARELERLISADPALAITLMRAASAAVFAKRESVTTIIGALHRLGLNSVKTLTLSFSLQAIINAPMRRCEFDARRFSKHSVFVGVLSQVAFVRVRSDAPSPSRATADEVFACGLVHELSIPLVARLAPETFEEVRRQAIEERRGFRETFSKRYGRSIDHLGVIAAEAWGLPHLLTASIGLSLPGSFGEQEPVVPVCLRWADSWANAYGMQCESWDVDWFVDGANGLVPDHEFDATIRAVDEYAETFARELCRRSA